MNKGGNANQPKPLPLGLLAPAGAFLALFIDAHEGDVGGEDARLVGGVDAA